MRPLRQRQAATLLQLAEATAVGAGRWSEEASDASDVDGAYCRAREQLHQIREREKEWAASLSRRMQGAAPLPLFDAWHDEMQKISKLAAEIQPPSARGAAALSVAEIVQSAMASAATGVAINADDEDQETKTNQSFLHLPSAPASP